VVSEAVESQLGYKYKVERICGSDRFKTAVAVGQKIKQEKDFDTVIIATGLDFPDAMAIAPLQQRRVHPYFILQKKALTRILKRH